MSGRQLCGLSKGTSASLRLPVCAYKLKLQDSQPITQLRCERVVSTELPSSNFNVQPVDALSGPDGSRHSSDQHPKDINCENSNNCPIFVQECLSSRRQTPEGWNFCVFTVFEFLSHLPRNSRASRGQKFRFSVFCGLKLLGACLKAPARTGYVRDAQSMPQS